MKPSKEKLSKKRKHTEKTKRKKKRLYMEHSLSLRVKNQSKTAWKEWLPEAELRLFSM